MKYSNICVIGFFLFFSCSTDPCEQIACVNGSCLDGSCMCDEGFFGETCDVSNIEGFYRLTKLQYGDCPSLVNAFDISGTNEEPICTPNSQEDEVCFNYWLFLFDGFKLLRTEIITVNDVETWNRQYSYTYEARGDELRLVAVDESVELLMKIQGDKLSILYDMPESGDNCDLLEEFTRF